MVGKSALLQSTAGADGAVVPIDKHRMKASADAIVGRLARLAAEQVTARVDIEAGWLEDLRQYEGIYEPDVLKNIKSNESSEMFANVTRWHTNAWAARIGDMMFPTDDKNYEISPTPNPELSETANRAAEEAAKAAQEATQAQQEGGPEAAAPIVEKGNALAKAAGIAQAVLDQAKKSCGGMERVIDDQLRECGYNIQARAGILDSCKLGGAVLKGPLVSNRPKRAWVAVPPTPEDTSRGLDPTPGYWSLEAIDDPAPQSVRVNMWSIFPEMGAASWDDKEFLFERHLPNAARLRRLRDLPGFDRAAINAILAEGPTEAMPTYLAEVRSLDREATQPISKRFIAWEYYGPVERQEMIDLIQHCQPAAWEDWLAEVQGSDEQTFNVVIWFCQGRLLKFADWPNDTGDFIHDYLPFMDRPDSGPLSGIGVPRILRDPQAAINGGWRMVLDNGALSAGPQIVIDKAAVAPADNSWRLLPRKVWHLIKASVPGTTPPFQAFNITNNQAELANIIKLAREFADEEASLPQIAQGEQGEHVTPTAQGMSMLMGSANVIFRWCIRNWDDKITSPHIERYYAWNMCHNPDESIKGDMRVVARGTSVLLAKQATAATVTAVAERWTVHPVLGPLVDAKKAATSALKALSVAPDAILKSEEQAKADAIAAASQPPEPSPQQITAEAMLKRAEIDGNTRVTVAQIGQQVAMEELAAQYNMSVDKLRTMLEGQKMRADSDERRMAAQVAVDQRKDMAAAANVKGAEGGGKGIA